MAFYELMFKENLTPAPDNKVMNALTDLTNHIEIGQSPRLKSENDVTSWNPLNELIIDLLAKLKDGEGTYEPWEIQNDEKAQIRQYVRMLHSRKYTTQEEIGLAMDPPVSQATAHRLENSAIAEKMITKFEVKDLKEFAVSEKNELEAERITPLLNNLTSG